MPAGGFVFSDLVSICIFKDELSISIESLVWEKFQCTSTVGKHAMHNETFFEIPSEEYALKWGKDSNGIKYQSLFLENIESERCVVLLSGTSTRIGDIHYFIKKIYDAGYSVASIERFIGGPFDIDFKPETERRLALEDLIFKLKGLKKIDRFIIIAHSYASFEVVRFLIEDPDKYKDIIENIFFINPAGFNKKNNFVLHCFRFLFIFILKEYLFIIYNFFCFKRNNLFYNDFISRKLKSTNSLFINTVINPIRTFREVKDIVSFDIEPLLDFLVNKHDYIFNFVINLNDELLSALDTLEKVKKLVHTKRLIIFDGNHMDPLINDKQIEVLLNKLK